MVVGNAQKGSRCGGAINKAPFVIKWMHQRWYMRSEGRCLARRREPLFSFHIVRDCVRSHSIHTDEDVQPKQPKRMEEPTTTVDVDGGGSSISPDTPPPPRDDAHREALRDEAAQLVDLVLATMYDEGMSLAQLLKFCWRRAADEAGEGDGDNDVDGLPLTDRSGASWLSPRHNDVFDAESLLRSGGGKLERAVEKAVAAIASVEELLPPSGDGAHGPGGSMGDAGGGALADGFADRLASGFGLSRLAERARGAAGHARRRASAPSVDSPAGSLAARRLERAHSRATATTEAYKQERRDAKLRDAQEKAEAAGAARLAKEAARAEAKARDEAEAAAKARGKEEREAAKAAQEAATKEAARAKAEADAAAKAAAKAEAKAEQEAKKEAKADAKARRRSDAEHAKAVARAEAEEAVRQRLENEAAERKEEE